MKKDILILTIYIILMIVLKYSYDNYVSYATLGSLFLIFASLYLFSGKIMISTFLYTIADLCWAMLAYDSGDILGTGSIIFAIFVGIGVMYKMKRGIFVKNLNKENYENID
jgi:hypothetical protein